MKQLTMQCRLQCTNLYRAICNMGAVSWRLGLFLFAFLGLWAVYVRISYVDTPPLVSATTKSITTKGAGSITNSKSTPKDDVYTLKAISYDAFRAPSPGRDALDPVLQSIPVGLTMLDLGCGSGAFLKNLMELRPEKLDAIDRNGAMINQSLKMIHADAVLRAAMQLKTLHIQQMEVVDLPSVHYDVVFCAQILQNLTPDASLATKARKDFLLHIFRVLKPGGQLVLTTRAISPGLGGRWSHLYWYADPAIAPRAVSIMETMVPRRPLDELVQAGFTRAEQIPSKDIVVRPDAYLVPTNLKNPAFRSADSFFQHVQADELEILLANIERRSKDGTLNAYVKQREALRRGNGHVVTLIAYRPNATVW